MLCVEVYAGQNQKEAAVVSSTRHNRKIRKRILLLVASPVSRRESRRTGRHTAVLVIRHYTLHINHYS